MTDYKYPKTIAAVQKRDRSQWEIGDALIRECGPPPLERQHDKSLARMEAAAAEIETLKIEGYTVSYLSKLRIVSHNFPTAQRNRNVCWNVYYSAGTPEMLDVLIEAAGKKKLDTELARKLRGAINEREDSKREREPGHKRAPSRRKRTTTTPSKEERKGLALIAEVLDWIKDIKTYSKGGERITERVEKNLPNLVSEEVDYLVETSLSAAEVFRKLGDVARKLKTNKRSHLTAVEGGKSHG